MSRAQALARRQQVVEELCGATIRALSGQPDLHFRGQRLHRGLRALPLHAPHLYPDLESAAFASFRGAADAMALRVDASDAALHERLSPVQPVARLVFELLEQFRAESLVHEGWPGVRLNLRHGFSAWARAYHDSGLATTVGGRLFFAVALVCRARVTNEPVEEAYVDLIESPRGALAPRIGAALVALRRARHDQARYAVHALAIAATVADTWDVLVEQDDGQTPIGENEALAAFALLLDWPSEGGAGSVVASTDRQRRSAVEAGGYRVYTRRYDQVCGAAELVREEVRRQCRERLDELIRQRGVPLQRLARELRSMLALPASDGWDTGHEEGQVDGRSLARLVAAPAERRLFRQPRSAPQADCVVTFLVDCSGSMRQHMDTLAVLLDVFARALELAGAASEILGFTTRSWNGGRAWKDWLAQGRLERPGRLNELRHIVFKDADSRWRRSRAEIAVLLEPTVHREGVDGEAVAWAAGRLSAREEARKLLVVVSDGSPMDSATTLANGAQYLDEHLREVVRGIESSGRIEVFGLGIGLFLSAGFSRSHVLDAQMDNTNRMLREIAQLIGSRRQR